MKKFITSILFIIICAITAGQESFKDKRDGNVYGILNISGVLWMTENLKFEARQGASFFDNDPNNHAAYGLLYDWKTAMESCPEGWHLPSGAEYRNLTNYFEQTDAWDKIVSDSATFGIQLGGMQDYEGTFSEMDESGYYWTSTEYNISSAEYFSYLLIDGMRVIDISRFADILDIQGTEKSNKYSVRCVKD